MQENCQCDVVRRMLFEEMTPAATLVFVHARLKEERQDFLEAVNDDAW